MNNNKKQISFIDGYDGDYAITSMGEVISYKQNPNGRRLATYLQDSGYENIKLSKNNQTYHHLVHRLVAEAFIPNPNNLPEVNHKNKIRNDNRLENLEWCTRKQNLEESYETMPPTRNFFECTLYEEFTNKEIGQFGSIREAATWASENLGCSKSGMIRNYKSKGFYVVKQNPFKYIEKQ